MNNEYKVGIKKLRSNKIDIQKFIDYIHMPKYNIPFRLALYLSTTYGHNCSYIMKTNKYEKFLVKVSKALLHPSWR